MEFMRIGTHGTSTGKSFDISLVRCDGVGSETFKNIDKFELKVLVSYFKRSGIKMRQINQDTNQDEDMDGLNSSDLDQEIA